MNGVGTCPAGRVHHGSGVEVVTDTDRLVGLGHEGGLGVTVGEDSQGADAHGPGGTEDPSGDLTPVSDQ